MYSSHTQLAVHTTPVPSSKTGVIVLSMDCRILHINDRAGDFARLFNKEPRRLPDHATTAPLSHPLMDLFHEVLANLEKHIAAEDWSQFEITHLAHSVDGIVLLRGFGIPDQARRQQSRVVLTLHHRSGPSPL
ncbi:MAG: hypothetical protein HY348_01725 [Nitrospira defluvii]|nr:hypothetical protein [Nitrospira defluvii]